VASPGTKTKIRNLMSALFSHAIRHEWAATHNAGHDSQASHPAGIGTDRSHEADRVAFIPP
jgi:hypothetical protein